MLVATRTVPVLNNLLTIPDKATIANTSIVCMEIESEKMQLSKTLLTVEREKSYTAYY